MRVLFDAQDLEEKLSALLRLEGLEVQGPIIWGFEDGKPSAQMTINPMPAPAPPPAPVEVIQAQPPTNEISAQLVDLADTVGLLAKEVAFMRKRKDREVSSKKEANARDAESDDMEGNAGDEKELTPAQKMRKIRQELERDAEIIQNPMGGTPRKMRRPLSVNESVEFPKDKVIK